MDKNTVKPVLSDHLKIDKANVLMENGSLMKVSNGAKIRNRYNQVPQSSGAFCNTFDLH